ncbi:hypothetical protein GWI33_023378 [Rhynchophorus ferrugineus]|uniref:Uncharacterized protein n=1 Tax=Rhynchophorus ferrugineus TaxID=354439 RepID=A0A834MGY1_RHYFE|nr:hypothetical protein GWI33_023378 [Rhynchophorus ferrugineus]
MGLPNTRYKTMGHTTHSGFLYPPQPPSDVLVFGELYSDHHPIILALVDCCAIASKNKRKNRRKRNTRKPE